MLAILGVTLPFFALILCGYVARGKGIMKEGSQRALNDFVLFFALPALMVRTIGAIPIAEILNPAFLATWTTVSAGMFATVALTAGLLLRQPGKTAVIQAFACAHGNVGYMGITLVIGVLGPAAAAPVSMAIVIDMLLLIPVVIALTEYLARRDGSPLRALATAGRAAIANPLVIPIIFGLALAWADVTLPKVVDDFLRVLGMAAVPAALFAIGVTLHGQPMRGAVTELALLCLMKLIVHPIAVALVATRAFGLEGELLVAAVLLAALPVANNVFVLATRYESRPGLISGAILVSTSLALVTFNLWAALALG